MTRRKCRAFAAVAWLAVARLVGPAIACADPADDPPDPAFLEYLGSWQGGDDAWVALEQRDAAKPHAAGADPPPAASRKDPAPEHRNEKQRSHDD